jgi:hypothetical protein
MESTLWRRGAARRIKYSDASAHLGFSQTAAFQTEFIFQLSAPYKPEPSGTKTTTFSAAQNEDGPSKTFENSLEAT